jgi:hypothetical protein
MDVKCDLVDCFDISPEYFIPQRHMNQGHSYHENEYLYNQEIESLPDNSSLNGYFQTEKYFNEFRDLILSQFVFKSSYRDLAESYIQTIRKENKDAVIASIHVRRGDYVMFPDHHPPCSFSYYNSAIEELRIANEKVVYLIFSDDVDWCKTEFTDPSYIITDLNNPYSEMCAMSLCDHNIIANSSFSWWGAWLNKNPDKIVIAPARWFGPAISKDVSDIYCSGWNLI